MPSVEEQAYIHDKYLGELVNGMVLPETRQHLLAIAERMRSEEGMEGLILGGTELSLILQETEGGMPIMDSTAIHAEEVAARLLS